MSRAAAHSLKSQCGSKSSKTAKDGRPAASSKQVTLHQRRGSRRRGITQGGPPPSLGQTHWRSILGQFGRYLTRVMAVGGYDVVQEASGGSGSVCSVPLMVRIWTERLPGIARSPIGETSQPLGTFARYTVKPLSDGTSSQCSIGPTCSCAFHKRLGSNGASVGVTNFLVQHSPLK
jgi:hypothetical protein